MRTFVLAMAMFTSPALASDPPAEPTEAESAAPSEAAPAEGATDDAPAKEEASTEEPAVEPAAEEPATEEPAAEEPAAEEPAVEEPATEEAKTEGAPEGEETATTEPEPTGEEPAPITDPANVIAGRFVTTPDAPDAVEEVGPRPNKPLLLVATGLAVAGIATYAIALDAHGELFNSPERNYEDFDRLKSKANTFSVVGAGLGTAAIGTGVTAFIVGEF